MKDRVLLSVTEILDDEAGYTGGDLCDFDLHRACDDFLKEYGEKGRDAILAMLDFLKTDVIQSFERLKEPSHED